MVIIGVRGPRWLLVGLWLQLGVVEWITINELGLEARVRVRVWVRVADLCDGHVSLEN